MQSCVNNESNEAIGNSGPEQEIEQEIYQPVCPDTGEMMNWQIYIILCSDNSLYTGMTTDL